MRSGAVAPRPAGGNRAATCSGLRTRHVRHAAVRPASVKAAFKSRPTAAQPRTSAFGPERASPSNSKLETLDICRHSARATPAGSAGAPSNMPISVCAAARWAPLRASQRARCQVVAEDWRASTGASAVSASRASASDPWASWRSKTTVSSAKRWRGVNRAASDAGPP